MGFGKDGRGVIIRQELSQALSTLGQGNAIFIGTKIAIADDFRMLKSEVFANVRGLTAGEGIGLYLGLADGDLSTTEIEQALDVNGPVDTNDVVDTDLAERPVRLIAALDENFDGTKGPFTGEGNCRMVVTKPRWTYKTTKSWNWFVYNKKGSALTTGATANLQCTSFGVWIR